MPLSAFRIVQRYVVLLASWRFHQVLALVHIARCKHENFTRCTLPPVFHSLEFDFIFGQVWLRRLDNLIDNFRFGAFPSQDAIMNI